MSEDNLVNLDNLKTLLKIIKSRRSIRHFKKTPVSGEDIKLLVDAATWAPSACNKQMWEFIYVSEEDIKDKLVNQAGAQPNIKRAPCSLYVTYPSNVTKEGLANIQSASAAIQNLSLCASSMGLGTVWVEACGDPKIVRRILNIPKNQTIISAVCIGYPVMIPSPPQRRRIETVLHMGTFSNKLSGRKRPSDIKEWDENSLINYRSLGIRATSPSRHDFDCAWGADEVEEEAKLTNNFSIKNKIDVKNIYECLVFSGNTSVRILEKFPEASLTIADVYEDIIDFASKRIKRVLPKEFKNLQTHISGYSENIFPEDGKYDLIICHKKINMNLSLKTFLEQAKKHLNPNGIISLSFWNCNSMQAIGWKFLQSKNLRPVLCFNEGPLEPISPNEVIQVIKSTGFKIKEDVGLGLLSPIRNKYVYKFVTKRPLIKRFSRTRLMILKKD